MWRLSHVLLSWRSWNFFQCNINQDIMMGQMNGIAKPRVGNTSLLSLGYGRAFAHLQASQSTRC